MYCSGRFAANCLLPASDLERARRFYQDVIGLEAKEEANGGILYECGGNRVFMYVSGGAGTALVQSVQAPRPTRQLPEVTESTTWQTIGSNVASAAAACMWGRASALSFSAAKSASLRHWA